MALRGNLKDFSLPDVFQLVTFSRKTRRAAHQAGRGAEGSVWFRDGEVFFAQSNWHSRAARRAPRSRAAHHAASARARARALRADEGARAPARRRSSSPRATSPIRSSRPSSQEQIQDTIFDLMRWDEGDFDFEATARGRRRGHRAVCLHRERRHGGVAATRGMDPHPEEDPVHGRRLQDGHRAGRGYLRDLAEAGRVESAAHGGRHAVRRRARALPRIAPTSRSHASSTACSPPVCSSSRPTRRSRSCAPSVKNAKPGSARSRQSARRDRQSLRLRRHRPASRRCRRRRKHARIPRQRPNRFRRPSRKLPRHQRSFRSSFPAEPCPPPRMPPFSRR